MGTPGGPSPGGTAQTDNKAHTNFRQDRDLGMEVPVTGEHLFSLLL